MYNDLQHHGIKGQKWGVRRFQNKDGSLTAAGKSRKRNDNFDNTPTHEDHKKAHDKTSVKQMSDKELRDRINRLNMERQYSQLTQSEQNAGVKFVKNVLINAAQQTASKYVSQYMNKGVEYIISKAAKK